MKKQVLVFGSNGMAGHMIVKYLKTISEYEITTVARENAHYSIDVENLDELNKVINDTLETHVVINCIGVLLPDADKDPKRTVYLNGFLPHYLAYKYSRVIHISTDCVFDGKRGYMYGEKDLPNESSLYGRTKALGELKTHKDTTIRVSIIGPEIKSNNRSGLFNWVINEAPETMSGWTNALWNGITTLQLAKVIHQCIDEDIFSSGIIQPSSPVISKAELLQLIVNVFDLNKKVKFEEGPKTVNKCLSPSVGYAAPSHLEQLLELKKFYEN